MEKRHITAEDLYQLQILGDPQISPNGRYVIYTLQTTDAKTEQKQSHLWLVPTNGSAPPRQFTFGKRRDSHPRWSPDGRSLAFLSNRDDERQAQLYLIGLDGGEARPLTQLNGAVANFAWSPDGTRLVCQFRQKDPAVSEREKDEQKKKLGIVARRITSLEFRVDGVGYLPEERWHIWLIDAASGAASQLTSGDTFQETEPGWSPDGRSILFTSVRVDPPDLNWEESALYRIPVEGGEIEAVGGHNGRKFSGVYSPDGRKIAYLGRDRRGTWYQNDCLYLLDLADGQTRNLSAPHDLHCGLATQTDVGGGGAQTPPTWTADSAAIYCQVSQTGDQPLLRFPVGGGAPEAIIHEPGQVGAFSLDAAQSKITYLWGDLQRPGQLWLRDLANGDMRLLADPNADLLAELDLGHIEEVWFSGADGYRLHGWVTFPPDFDPARQYPTILAIHGGPMTQYGRAFFHEFFYLAAQGYVVYWSNPRGGLGYGEAHLRTIAGHWGTVDYADVMAWADWMAAQPYCDPTRMGVAGGSYGGYMTGLIIGRTERFRAAVAERVVSNLISFYGSSDLSATRAESLFGLESPPWETLAAYWEQSPMNSIGRAKTPTLVIHSEQDYRCPDEQGIQLFAALRRLGVPTELILFPEESHGLSRAGRTDRRIARLEHIRRWFDTYL